MNTLDAEVNLMNALDDKLLSAQAEAKVAFDADRESLKTLRLQCKAGTIRNAINYAFRAFDAQDKGEADFDIQRLVNLHEGHAAHMEELIEGNLNTADCAVYEGDLQAHRIVLEVLEAHRSEFV